MAGVKVGCGYLCRVAGVIPYGSCRFVAVIWVNIRSYRRPLTCFNLFKLSAFRSSVRQSHMGYGLLSSSAKTKRH